MERLAIELATTDSTYNDGEAILQPLWIDGMSLLGVRPLLEGPLEGISEAIETRDVLVFMVDVSERTRTRPLRNNLELSAHRAVRANKRVLLLTHCAFPAASPNDGLDGLFDLALPYADVMEVVEPVRSYLKSLTGLAPIDLRLHPPVERPEPDDAVVIGSEIESLLTWAERFVADESHPDDVRDEVDARRRQLLDELQLIGQGRGSSTVLTGLAAALLPLVRPARADGGLAAAADEVADAAIALGQASTSDEIVDAGEDVVAALDHVGEGIAGYGVDDLKAAALRTAGGWLEEDARDHLNAFLVAAREKVLPATATGAAGGVVTSWMGGPPWLVVTVVALGLLRARFPWIFRPPEDPPPA